MKPTKILACATAIVLISAILITTSQAGKVRGISSNSKPQLNPNGEPIQVELKNPFDEFTLHSDSLFDIQQLAEIPGTLVVVASSKDGKEQILYFTNSVRKDNAPKLEIKPVEFIYESYLLDVGAAVELGLPIASVGISANRKVEFRFFKSASCLMSNDTIDDEKYVSAASRVKQVVVDMGLTLKSIRIVSSVAALNSSHLVLEGAKLKSDVSGLGWKVGGNFYSSSEKAINKIKIGVNFANYAPPKTDNPKTPSDSSQPVKILLEESLKPTDNSTKFIEKIYKLEITE